LRVVSQLLRYCIIAEFGARLALLVADRGPLPFDDKVALLIQGTQIRSIVVLLPLSGVDLPLTFVGSVSAFRACARVEIIRRLRHHTNVGRVVP